MKLSAAVGRRSSRPTPSKAFYLLRRVQKTRLTALFPAESGPTLRGGEKMSTFSDAGAEAGAAISACGLQCAAARCPRADYPAMGVVCEVFSRGTRAAQSAGDCLRRRCVAAASPCSGGAREFLPFQAKVQKQVGPVAKGAEILVEADCTYKYAQV
jgi:hypothetical protein